MLVFSHTRFASALGDSLSIHTLILPYRFIADALPAKEWSSLQCRILEQPWYLFWTSNLDLGLFIITGTINTSHAHEMSLTLLYIRYFRDELFVRWTQQREKISATYKQYAFFRRFTMKMYLSVKKLCLFYFSSSYVMLA